MHADGVDVFHRTDGDRRVVFVPHDLEFDFLPALDALFDKNFGDRGQFQAAADQGKKLVLVCGESPSRAAEGERGAQDHRIADLRGDIPSFLRGMRDVRGQDRLAELFAEGFEHFPVFRRLDGFALRSEQLDPALPEDPLLFKLYGEVQPDLPADPG